MSRFLFVSFFIIVGSASLHAETETTSEERIADLVKQLGDEEFALREAASIELEDIGEPALAALRKARTTPDAEVQLRVRRLLRNILLNSRRSRTTDMRFALIEAGAFPMGSPNNEKDRLATEWRHEVRITRPFLLGIHEVTQETYNKVVNASPSSFAESGESKAKVEQMATSRFPVENVSWFDALAFCNALSQRDGFKPYYNITEIERDGNAIVKAEVAIVGGNGYRLPTEAEWEYACRAFTVTPFYFGTRNTGKEANVKPARGAGGYGSTSIAFQDLKRPTTVGSYPPNPWGLRDMHGNVAEWVWDWYDAEFYRNSPVKDPTGPKKTTHRVSRGGSWLMTEASARSASRFYHVPSERKNYIGFRVARTP